MKIGSLFIALGFQVNGKRDLDDVERSVERAAVKALKLTVAVNAVNAALLAMLDASARAGMALLNFERTTDLSAEKLQFWQHAAAVAGVGADVLGSKIKQLQDVRASFALGEPQNVGAWSMLGVDPRQDPFVIIQQLRRRLAGVKDVGVARALLGKVGLEELLPLLRSTNQQFEKWERNFVLNQQQIEKLANLKMAWESLKVSVAAVTNQFAAALAPVVERLAVFFEALAERLAKFTKWLGSGSTGATVLRRVLQTVVVLLLVLGAALAGLTAALGVLLGALSLISPALLGVLAPFAAIAAAVVLLILLLDDLYTSVAGGKSFLDWNKILSSTLDNVLRLAHSLEILLEVYRKFGAFKTLVGSAEIGPAGLAAFAGAAFTSKPPGPTTNSTKIDVHVDGSASPEATGRAVVRSIKDQLRSAQTQAPAPSR